jgi:hypothetical protein
MPEIITSGLDDHLQEVALKSANLLFEDANFEIITDEAA